MSAVEKIISWSLSMGTAASKNGLVAMQGMEGRREKLLTLVRKVINFTMKS